MKKVFGFLFGVMLIPLLIVFFILWAIWPVFAIVPGLTSPNVMRRYIAWKHGAEILGAEGFWDGSTWRGAWFDLKGLPWGLNLFWSGFN